MLVLSCKFIYNLRKVHKFSIMIVEKSKLPHNFCEILAKQLRLSKSYISMCNSGTMPEPKTHKGIQQRNVVVRAIKQLSAEWLKEVQAYENIKEETFQ